MSHSPQALAQPRGATGARRQALSLSDPFCLAVILLSVAALAALFLWTSAWEFPMDDSYIHFVYAENLARHGALVFNDASEVGVGTTSLLWVLALAGADRLGVPLHLAAKLLGLASLLVLGVGGFRLLRAHYPAPAALAVTLLVVTSGHLLWFALSGMETVLFLALAVAALLCYQRQQWLWLGLVLGLLVLTRVEGALLGAAIALVDLARYRTLRRGLLLAGLVGGVLAGAWLGYLWLRTGHLLPTSGLGKHITSYLSVRLGAARNPLLAWLALAPGLAYPLSLLVYLLEFVLGGAALPPPYLVLGTGFGGIDFELSVWAIGGWLLMVGPLLWVSARRVRGVWGALRPGAAPDGLPWAAFLLWLILHNVAYAVYLPILGTASRYAAPNHLALWAVLALGVWHVRRPAWRWLLGMGLAGLALANGLYWNRVYDANLEHMNGVRLRAAEYVRQHVPAGEVCAASDIGAVRYAAGRPIVDLGGLLDPNLNDWYAAGELDRYLVEHGVTCLVLPGRMGTTAGGVFDLATEMGLADSPRVRLHRLNVFEIDRDRWLFGYRPVVNYQAAVSVYRVEHLP